MNLKEKIVNGKSICGTLVNIPSVVTFSLSSILLPKLALDFKLKNDKEFSKKVSVVFKVLLLIAVPCSLLILFYPNQLIDLIYRGSLDGFSVDGVSLTAKLMLCSAFNVVFLCLSQFFSIVLQARDKKYLPAVNNLLGVIVKTVLIVCFVPSKQLNIMAFTLASSVGYFVIFVLNLLEILKENILIIKTNYWIKLGIANVLIVLLSVLLLAINSTYMGFVIMMLASIVIYFFVLWLIKPLNKYELNKFIKNN